MNAHLTATAKLPEIGSALTDTACHAHRHKAMGQVPRARTQHAEPQVHVAASPFALICQCCSLGSTQLPAHAYALKLILWVLGTWADMVHPSRPGNGACSAAKSQRCGVRSCARRSDNPYLQASDHPGINTTTTHRGRLAILQGHSLWDSTLRAGGCAERHTMHLQGTGQATWGLLGHFKYILMHYQALLCTQKGASWVVQGHLSVPHWGTHTCNTCDSSGRQAPAQDATNAPLTLLPALRMSMSAAAHPAAFIPHTLVQTCGLGPPQGIPPPSTRSPACSITAAHAWTQAAQPLAQVTSCRGAMGAWHAWRPRIQVTDGGYKHGSRRAAASMRI